MTFAVSALSFTRWEDDVLDCEGKREEGGKEKAMTLAGSPSPSSDARPRNTWSLVVSASLESKTDESTSRLRAVPKVTMLLSAMAGTKGDTKLSKLSKVRGNEQRETRGENTARQRGERKCSNGEEEERGDNCQTKSKRRNLAWLETEMLPKKSDKSTGKNVMDLRTVLTLAKLGTVDKVYAATLNLRGCFKKGRSTKASLFDLTKPWNRCTNHVPARKRQSWQKVKLHCV